mmetsp:Transcript_8300/g.8458  ORF Transcript_8300/g.8458 Transcript_8300/m.8458 type:complete len:372 (+) Transcript_8300:148-1263(+)
MSSRLFLSYLVRTLYFLSCCIIIDADGVEAFKNVYNILTPCILDTPFLNGRNLTLKYPNDAEEHYKTLLHITSAYRNFPPHKYKEYKGPWIENYFISTFLPEPLSYFHGLFPLFIQWVDIHVNSITRNHNSQIPSMSNLMNEMEHSLRSDVIYFTVSQDDEGLFELIEKFPNILIFSAGGYGHIPIPLIKGNIDYIPMNYPAQYTVGFYGGTLHSSKRLQIFKELSNITYYYNISHKFKQSQHWISDISHTLFNFAPRGYGRTSFRVAEIIQIGRLPIYIYSDIPWVPYRDTSIDYNNFGYVCNVNDLDETVKKMLNCTPVEVQRMLHRVKDVREYYTYEGVMKQIKLFLQDPLGPAGGYLRCNRVPDTRN